ncbi:hypothetical protein [Devosia sp.]|uniref:hypothetical protein n=1 Tax=Devosia sp. TaxID=1871048 RepID=UPI002734E9A8|nr:hypothetical protein [Devosia sp.]MDP2779615.1 hypothetical protein [Devosia sp.]
MPSINPEREKLIAKLRRDLAGLERIPARVREAEHADERAETVRALLRDLGADPQPEQLGGQGLHQDTDRRRKLAGAQLVGTEERQRTVQPDQNSRSLLKRLLGGGSTGARATSTALSRSTSRGIGDATDIHQASVAASAASCLLSAMPLALNQSSHLTVQHQLSVRSVFCQMEAFRRRWSKPAG